VLHLHQAITRILVGRLAKELLVNNLFFLLVGEDALGNVIAQILILTIAYTFISFLVAAYSRFQSLSKC